MLKELAVERLRFTCPSCRDSWTADYDVQHVEDPFGDVFQYYSLDGVPVEVPTAPGAVTCPRCGRWMMVDLLARRTIPLVQAATGAPGRRVDPGRAVSAGTAPLLPGSTAGPAPSEEPRSSSDPAPNLGASPGDGRGGAAHDER